MSKYTAIVVGLGNIGFLYDNGGSLGNVCIQTHVSGFLAHNEIDLIGVVDVCEENTKKFTSKFDIPVYDSLEECLKNLKPDIVSIATPTVTHLKMLKIILNNLDKYKPHLILMEKPIAVDKYDAYEMKKLIDNIPCAINYIRNYLPEFEDLKNRIKKGELGKLLGGNCSYGKGLFNTASHFIALLQYILGDVGRGVASGEMFDGTDIDVDFDFKCKNENIIFSVDKKDADISTGELHLKFEKCKIDILNCCEKIKYNFHDGSIENAASTIDVYQLMVVNNIVKFLNKKSDLMCDFNQGLKASDICWDVLGV